MNIIKKVQLIIFIVIICFSFTACKKEETPEISVSKMVEAVKNFDEVKIKKYLGIDVISEVLSNTKLYRDDEQMLKDIVNSMIKHLQYEIVRTEIDDANSIAIVDVKFINADLVSIFKKITKEMISDLLLTVIAKENFSKEEINQKLFDFIISELDNLDSPKITKNVEINMYLADKEWKIENSEEVIDAMLGGFISYSNTISNILE